LQAAETGRRINQLYNDVNAIYGLLDTIHETQRSHGKQIESIKTSLTDIRATQMRHDNRLNELDLAVVGVSEQLKEMRITQMRHENRFDAQDRKLDLIMEALNASAD
jgi:chromosome segregation ATPase